MGTSDQDPVVKEYAWLAARYDHRWATYIEASIRETLARLDPRPGDRVLDVGCGTGALLQALSQSYPGARLSGVDASPEMLGVAAAKLGPSVELAPARAESLPFPDATFDILVSSSVFHYLRRPEEALREFARVLKPGGRVVITDWCDDYLACLVLDRLLRVFNRAHFRTYGREAYARLLEASPFEEIAIDRYKISWLWGLMTARARKPD